MENKKKKVLIIVLLLFAVIGIAGYGVYSYYSTTGEFGDGRYNESDTSNIIHLNGSFNPQATSSESGANAEFVGNGGSFQLACDEVDENFDTTCTGNLYVYNDGSTPISIVVEDAEVESDMDIEETIPSVSLSSSTIYSGSRATLTATANVHFKSGTEDSEEQEVDSPVEPSGQVRINYKLRATQSH